MPGEGRAFAACLWERSARAAATEARLSHVRFGRRRQSVSPKNSRSRAVRAPVSRSSHSHTIATRQSRAASAVWFSRSRSTLRASFGAQ